MCFLLDMLRNAFENLRLKSQEAKHGQKITSKNNNGKCFFTTQLCLPYYQTAIFFFYSDASFYGPIPTGVSIQWKPKPVIAVIYQDPLTITISASHHV